MGKSNIPLSRRNLLKTTLAAVGLRAFPLSAATSNRALVCIYLFGGNDSNNMVVPLSAYDSYAAIRGPLAIPQSELVRVTSGLDQAQYGFHPALAEVAALFQEGALAVVSNVGALDGPAVPDPFLSYFPSGYATPAWAAEMAQVTPEDRKSLFVDFPNLAANASNRTSELSLIAPGVSATQDLREAVAAAAKLGGGQWGMPFPETGLGQQLRQVAALVKAGASFGMERQVFLVGVSGYGMSSNQQAVQSTLFRELSPAMAAFFAATREMGIAQNVTTYTDTEFSRTLRPNARRGSDPAWGGHNFVMGGGVLGGSVHGLFPLPSIGGAHDVRNRGILRPNNSKEQFHATLANWFGVSRSDLDRYLPGLRNTARPTLGFMVTG